MTGSERLSFSLTFSPRYPSSPFQQTVLHTIHPPIILCPQPPREVSRGLVSPFLTTENRRNMRSPMTITQTKSNAMLPRITPCMYHLMQEKPIKNTYLTLLYTPGLPSVPRSSRKGIIPIPNSFHYFFSFPFLCSSKASARACANAGVLTWSIHVSKPLPSSVTVVILTYLPPGSTL